jgi:hypothetical protein
MAACLDAIRLALREGRLADLAPLAEALEAALDGPGEVAAGGLDRLRRQACANQDLLSSAAQGVRAARRRLAEIRAIDAGFVAYGPSGARDGTRGPEALTRRF